ncbi:putative ribonuclease H-like domain-containing protein [Tanacetum coccineum]
MLHALGNTNDVNTAKPAYEVSTVSPNVNIDSPHVIPASFQIHEDVLEAMDLKWQLSLLSKRAKSVEHQGTKRVSSINQDNTRKHGNNKDISSKEMLAIDGIGFDWSDMAEEQCDDLIVKLNQTEFTATTYKRGLATIEEQLITYRKNEVLFSEEVAVLKREVACKDYEINVLKSEFEKVKQEKEGIKFKIEKFDIASKSLNKLLENDSKKNSDDSLVKEQVSKDTSSFVESPLNVDKETIFLVDKKIKFVKPNNHEKPVKKSVRFTWVFFLSSKDETSKILKNFIKEIENLMDKKVKIIRSDNGTEFKNKVMDDFWREKGIKREYSVARTPQQNGVAERRNRTLIEAARTMLADSKLPTTFWVEAVSTACYVQNRVLVVKPHNKIPYELLEVQSLMNLQKDASYFDSPSKDVDNGKLKSAADDQKQIEDGLDNDNDEEDKYEDDSSPKEVNAVGQHVNIVSPKVNTGSFKLNTIDSSVISTTSLNDQDSPKDMFKMGANHTLEATHVEFFSDEDEPEVDLGNITNSYTVPTTPNTRIHKDHPIENVISDVKSSVQTRRMTKPTSKQGFLSAVYEHKTHDTLNTRLYACFLSQIEPTSIAKALFDSSWVEAMQE